jgi:hypothetical protein
MADLDQLLSDIRSLAERLVARAMDSLEAGAPVERVHDHYVVAAFGILDEAEAQAILAGAGVEQALSALKQCVTELETLTEEMAAEFRP